ncbi:MAG: methyltransferase domain-containing protein, partial [Phycisphaerae bacterium]
AVYYCAARGRTDADHSKLLLMLSLYVRSGATNFERIHPVSNPPSTTPDGAGDAPAGTGRAHITQADLKGDPSMVWQQQYQSREHAQFYAKKHDTGLMRRLSNYFERRMIRRACKRVQRRGRFKTVLDCASGTGRFLPTLAGFGADVIVLDTSWEMLEQGCRYHSLFRIAPRTIVACAADIPLSDQSVDLVLCSRFFHHLPDSESRVLILREFARITRLGIVITFFDACSYRGWRRSRKKWRPSKAYGRYVITRAQCRREGELAGFTLIGMDALLRFHTEITAAAFVKDGPTPAAPTCAVG